MEKMRDRVSIFSVDSTNKKAPKFNLEFVNQALIKRYKGVLTKLREMIPEQMQMSDTYILKMINKQHLMSNKYSDPNASAEEIKCTQQQLLQSVIQPDTEEAKKIGFSEKARLFVQGDKFLTNFGLEG